MDSQLIPLEFLTSAGQPLPAQLVQLRGEGDEVRLEIEVERPAWARVVAEQIFGDVLAGGAGFGNDEDVTAPVRMLLAPVEGSQSIGEVVDPVLGAEQWRAVEVWQRLPLPPGFDDAGARLSTGFRVGVAAAPLAAEPATDPLAAPPAQAPLLDVVRGWLADHELQSTLVAGQTVLRLDGEGANGSWVLWIETREDDDLCIVWSSWPQEIPLERRGAVMELVTRVNTDIQVGAFELDLGRGQLSFRTSLDVTDDRLSEALLARLVGANVETFDDYLPALDLVLAGEDPVTALQATAGG